MLYYARYCYKKDMGYYALGPPDQELFLSYRENRSYKSDLLDDIT